MKMNMNTQRDNVREKKIKLTEKEKEKNKARIDKLCVVNRCKNGVLKHTRALPLRFLKKKIETKNSLHLT
jgi:hypothetical protein